MISQKKLGLFTRFFLEMKGKKDARKNIICSERADINSLTSPFIKEELSLCLSKIHKEYEDYLNQKEKLTENSEIFEKEKIKLQSEINSLDSEKKMREEQLKELNEKKYNINDFHFETNIIQPDEELFNDYEKEECKHRTIEIQAQYEVELAKDRKQKKK